MRKVTISYTVEVFSITKIFSQLMLHDYEKCHTTWAKEGVGGVPPGF